ncbi:hypothetical protein [Enterobacter cancerogenus]|uniref:hypothetical protein n=1 Tax=Enterobacter cancerogenus TaxID=69218 RepID=UPI0005370397|nr:hypothetical protein [Enterobacter cancerogenus]KGT88610.1 hypothetical protein NH00_18520 [Enterobacter cancerogenus]
MKNLENMIEGFEISDVRAAFYYLSRYLKQADYIHEYQKDFFEDDFQSAPSETAKKLTFSLIEFIETSAGKKASDFSDQEYFLWMDAINKIESELDPEPSYKTRKSAENIIEELFVPEIRKKD